MLGEGIALSGLTGWFYQDHATAEASPDENNPDSRAMARLLPYQNLFTMRSLLNQAQSTIKQTIGEKN